MLSILAAAPWLVLLAALPVLLRQRPRLRDYAPVGPDAPLVSVIVPTRNDADRIGVCLATLLASEYPRFEVLVVDQQSTDGTREIIDVLASRADPDIRVIDPGPVPADWAVRSWSCRQGAEEASGELLLFTEAGTTHTPSALGRAVSVLRAEKADLVTVEPDLTMDGFWERLVMPHVWVMLSARFPSARIVNQNRTPRNVIAHHQFLLFRRSVYDEIGGHRVVGLGAVEDLAIPQAVVGAGFRLFLAHGTRSLETRMVRSFEELTGDWPAAVPPASRSTVAPWAGVFVPWLVAFTPVALFLAPPLVLLGALLRAGASPVTGWALATTSLSLAFWMAVYARFRIRPAYAVAYPVGAAVTAWIFVRSVLRSSRGS